MYTYINMYMYMYIYIYIHIYIIIYESFLFARSPCRAAWVVPKIPEGSISNVIGREVWEEGEAPRVLIKQEQDPPTNVGEFSRSNQKPFPGHPPSARSACEVIVSTIATTATAATTALPLPLSVQLPLPLPVLLPLLVLRTDH